MMGWRSGLTDQLYGAKAQLQTLYTTLKKQSYKFMSWLYTDLGETSLNVGNWQPGKETQQSAVFLKAALSK